jgi:hypothetical protein
MKSQKSTALAGIFIALVTVIGFTTAACGGGSSTQTQQLDRPSNLNVSGTTLTWNSINNANGYLVSVDSNEYEAYTASFSLSVLSNYRTYTIKVKALGDGIYYTDSAWSDTINYEFLEPDLPALDTPQNVQIEGANVSWDTVSDAVRYSVDINGIENMASTSSYSLASITTVGTYLIKVKAIGDNETYKNSDWSSTVNYTVMPNEPTLGLQFTLINNGTAYSVSRGTATDSIIVIPPIYNGLPVTIIEEWGFWDYAAMTSVIIPNSVTSIGYSAFDGCIGLTNVTVPNSVTSIGYGAFNNCNNLTSITIPFVGAELEGDSITHFSHIFGYPVPASLKSVTITGGTSIGNSAFYGCSSIENISLPNSVTSIGEWAFYDCSSLTNVTIPNSVQSIGEWGFRDCERLITITIPGSVTSIGYGAFYGCNSLVSITTPLVAVDYSGDPSDSFRIIFSYEVPASLKSVTITGVTRIGDGAFQGCSSIENISLPNSVTSIGDSAFKGCSSLTSITIPSGVISIGDSAFYGCNGLTNVTIPNSVQSIGEWVFANCSGLMSITIPNSIMNISYTSFYNCVSLESITIPDSVTSIDNFAFQNCNSLTSVLIPDSVTTIGDSAFYNCNSLTKVFYGGADITAWSEITIESLNWFLTETSRYYYSATQPIGAGNFWRFVDEVPTVWEAFLPPTPGLQFTLINDGMAYSVSKGTTTDTEIIIPPMYNNLPVTTIEEFGFKDYAALTSITIPNSVTNIGKNAFYSCSGLTSVTIPGSVQSIDEWAFYDCSSLKNVIMLSGITNIGNCMFYSCISLTSITIPDSVMSIGNSAFYNCDSLTTVFYGGVDNTAWSKITIGYSTLNDATLYYYSATQPYGPGNFWQLVNEVPTAWGVAAQQLTAPSNLQINNTTLTWNIVSNSSGYIIYIDDTEYPATVNSYSLSSLTTMRTYMIKVKAKGNGTTYSDSEWSGTTQYIVTQTVLDNLTDFGPDAVIKNTFNVANTTQWNEAVRNIGSGGENFIINIAANFSIAGLTNMTDDTFSAHWASNLKVSIRGADHTLTLSSDGSILRMTNSNSHTIILRDLTLMGQGFSHGNNSSLIHISNANCIMYDVKITGNSMATYTTDRNEIAGGGVYISNGTLTMNGGEISGNRVLGSGTVGLYGGGVYVMGVNGRFIMNGGRISGNSINNSTQQAGMGCGVFVRYAGTFIMNNGIISGNTFNSINTGAMGGGVYLYNSPTGYSGATFHMINGTIYGNTETDTSLRNTGSSGAALYMNDDGCTATYGPSGTGTSLTTTNNTIKVLNGVLQ